MSDTEQASTSTQPQIQCIQSNFPVPSPMVCKGNQSSNWEFFKQQWRDYEIATSLDKRDEKIRLATFRSIMGRDCVQILQNLGLTGENTLKAAEDALEAYFIPKKNIVYERYEFNTCTQQAEENIDSYVSRLRKLSSTCKFGALTDDLIRDRLIIGLNSRSTQLRLLKEQDLSLTKALGMCRASENAEKQVKVIHNKEPSSENINIVKTRQTRRRQQGESTARATQSNFHRGSTTKPTAKPPQTGTQRELCFFCGNKRHQNRKECPAYGQTCRKCKKVNHFAKVCRQEGKERRQVNQVKEESEDSDDSILSIEEITAVKGGGKRLTAKLTFYLPGDVKDQFECQLDTGATCNVISHKDLMILLQEGDPPVKPSSVRLRLFDGTIVKPVGETTLMIERKGKHWPIKFQVVEVNNSPLISAETCKKLDLIKVNVEPVDYVKAEDLTTLTREFILDNYKDVFEGLGHIGDSSFVLNPDIKPVQHTPRRIPIALQDKVKDKLDDLETKGIIAKVSEPTEWISSMVVVTTPKKIRICLDPLDLNKAIQRPKYQMPTLEEVLPRITNAKVFSTLDAKDGFYQIKLDEQSSRKTTFWTPFGRYRYLRMPFGLNLAPEEFERKLHEHLDDLPGIIVLRDDILVVGNGETQEQAEQNHDQNLKRLLERARKVNLRLNSSKMCLRQPEVKFMGHIISKEGLKPDPDKVKAVENMPKPTSKKELLSLLGFVNYLAKFLPKLSEVTQPLRDLTAKEAKFMWAPQHDAAFNKVKKLVTEHPVLKFYDVKKPVTIQCDASERGLGAALLQDGQPISFASRTLSKTEQQYAQIEKECLAIVFACNKFNQYIAGKEEIIVESDHKPLQIIFKKSILTAPQRLQRMLLRLQRYNLRVTYKPGSQMYLADHLSRASLPLVDEFKNQFEIFAVELEGVNPFQFIKVSSERLAQIQKSTGQDPVLETLKSTTLTGWPETKDQLPLNIREYWNYREEITLHNGILLKNQRVIIPKVMRPEVLTRIHSSHQGISSCIRKAKDVVFWPGMATEIKELVEKCSVCAEYQTKNAKEPMQTHKIPDRPWSRVGVDLFALQGRNYLVLVDYYSDFIEVDELVDGTTSTEVIQLLKHQFSRHGLPDTLVSDNGPQFACKEFNQFSTAWEFDHVSSSPLHPKANGKAESSVKIVKQLFKKAKADGQDPLIALLNYRNTPTEGLDSSPAQRLMSRRTRTLLPTVSSLLYPQIATDVPMKIEQKRRQTKFFYDKSAKILPQIEVGQDVRVAPLQRNQQWRSGTCLDRLSDRSYLIDVGNKVIRRNRQALKPTTPERHRHHQTNQTQSPEVIANQAPIPATKSKGQLNLDAPTTASELPTVSNQTEQPRATRTREVKLPSKFQDFVMT